MGYRIEYDAGESKRKPVRSRKWNMKSLAVMASAVTLVITLSLPAGRKWVRELVLPGDADVTSAALTALLDDLRAGEEFSAAVETFCVQIISGE